MADNEEEERSSSGRMRFQDESTTPREPTLAERRAREQARKRAEEAERAAEAEDSRKKQVRRKVFIGAGVTVGVVAVIAIGYTLAAPDEVVEAQCVDEESGVVVDDANCVTPAANSSTYRSGGGFYPIFIGSSGRQYRYNYGGSGALGQPVSGGTAVAPKGATVQTSSGRTLSGGSSGTAPRTSGGTGAGSSSSSGSAGSPSVSRGGLGVSGTGSSSGS